MRELPPGWEMARLDDLVDVLDSRRVPVNATERAERTGEVPYFGATGQVGWIDEALFDEELVLLGEDGAPFLDPSKPKAYLVSGPSWVNNHAHVLRARTGATTNRFLKYALDAADYRLHVNGTTRLKLTQKSMNAIPTPLPPLAEQERIVAAIEEHLSRLDAAESALESALARTAALNGRLTDIMLGGDWPVRKLAEVAEVRLGRQRSPKNATGDRMRPYLRAANVGWSGLRLADVKEMQFSARESETYELKEGDLLLSEASGSPGEVGKPAQWRGEVAGCCFQNTLIRVRLGDGLDPDFYEIYFRHQARTGRFADGSRGVGIHHLGARTLADWRVPIPPIEFQQSLVTEWRLAADNVDRMRLVGTQQAARSKTLRRSILAAAFSGQLVPQDPDDEPASVLLERIKAEMTAATPAKRTRKAKVS